VLRAHTLLFADNCFLFFRVDEIKAQCIKRILNKYEQALGQAINYTNSKVYLNRNTADNIKVNIFTILEVTEVLGTCRNLGIPSMIGRNKKVVFSYLKDRMWRKIQSLSSKQFFKAGRERF
jgi:hypothetical protein